MTDKTVPILTIKIPLSHWREIVRNLEKAAQRSQSEIEILQKAKVISID